MATLTARNLWNEVVYDRCTSDPRFASALLVAHITRQWKSGESVRFPAATPGTGGLAYLKEDGGFLSFNIAYTDARGFVRATDVLDIGMMTLHGWRLNRDYLAAARTVYRELLREHGAGL